MTHTNTVPKKIAVLLSGNGSNLQAIMDHQAQNPQLYEIALVLSNRPNAFGLQRAKKSKIPTKVIDHTLFESREEFDTQVQQILDQKKIDLIVLAGFMRILTADFAQHYLGRMLNIHPSLLPKYQGLNTHQRAIESGDTEHGLSVHFVTPELDGGPVIAQAKIDILNNETADSLQNRIHKLEHLVYPQVIQWFLQGRLQLCHNQVLLDQTPLASPLIIND